MRSARLSACPLARSITPLRCGMFRHSKSVPRSQHVNLNCEQAYRARAGRPRDQMASPHNETAPAGDRGGSKVLGDTKKVSLIPPPPAQTQARIDAEAAFKRLTRKFKVSRKRRRAVQL